MTTCVLLFFVVSACVGQWFGTVQHAECTVTSGVVRLAFP